jgi:large subunit ribosomal protein L1
LSDLCHSFSCRLNFDTKKGNIVVRGSADLPHGVGKKIRIAVFARGDKAEEARRAGATIVGAEEYASRAHPTPSPAA